VNGNYQVNSIAIGAKANPAKHLLITGNITVRAGGGGLKATIVPLVGISYSFSEFGFNFLRLHQAKCPCNKEQ